MKGSVGNETQGVQILSHGAVYSAKRDQKQIVPKLFSEKILSLHDYFQMNEAEKQRTVLPDRTFYNY